MNRLILVCIMWSMALLSFAEVKIPRLSPLPQQIEKNRIGLSGQWQFNPSPGSEFWKQATVNGWKSIEVPGEWVMQGFEVEKGREAAYFRTFDVPASWKGERVKLRCNGVYSESRLFINGKPVGSHLGGFTAFELDVTDAVVPGKANRIAIGVKSESVADSAANASRYAVHPLGGITRDLYLFTLPEANLSSFHATTSFDTLYTDARLTAQVEITNEATQSNDGLELLFALTDAKGKEVKLATPTYKLSAIGSNSSQKQSITFDIKAPEKWNSEHPYLYTLVCTLKQKGKTLHATTRRIGFRQIEVRGNKVYVNNYPIKLRGVCRHEVMPLRGRSVNNDQWRKDVELFRRGNVNYIRTSHYPPDEALLEACDELGMFVEEEAPFCWAHETKVSEDRKYATLVNQHIEMVNRDRTHPSVLIWSLGNESNLYKEYFKKSGEIIQEMDPTRPRIFSQWGPDADDNELEIGNHHYPGPTGPEMYRGSKRPIVFDEFAHLNAYNRLELAADPGVRSMWGELLSAMWDDMYHSEGVLGGALWAGIDDTFFLPGGRAVGYGTWGPVDGWRREKPEYWGMKKSFSPVKITQKGSMNANGEVAFDVENRHNFTNLSDCEIQWTAGKDKGTVKPDVAPRSEGIFAITLPVSARDKQFVSVSVVGALGFVLDEYEFRIQPERIVEKKEQTGKLSSRETAEAIIVNTLSGEYVISKRDGMLNGYEPQLMVLPLNAEGRGIQMLGGGQNFDPYTPVCSNWVASSIETVETPEEVIVHVCGAYKEAAGSLSYHLKANGELAVSYDFKVLKAVSPRQIGLVFTLPIEYSQLTWDRKGFWSVYPENHIGALQGTAQLFDPSISISGLAGPDQQPSVDWHLDQTAAGSNHFRSTKENIYKATLQNPTAKNFLTVVSDGTQAVRCWKDAETNTVKMLVADYNNAGKEQFLVSHAERDYRPLRIGDRIQGGATLIQGK